MHVYETSYDTALKPFVHDKNRGKWSSPTDFFFACVGHGFKVDAVFVMPSLIFGDLGIYGIIPYFLILATCVVPIVFLQSFLGQFSSTGFISVFRIAPLFKGIGYVSLAINVTTLTYYSLFGAIPMLFFFYTLRPTLPWSCEGAKEWMTHTNNTITPCMDNIEDKSNVSYSIEMKVPSLEFFRNHINFMDLRTRNHPENTFSWSLVLCTIVLWIMVGAVLCKPIETVAKFLRYSLMTVVGILCLCLIRFIFLPGAMVGIREMFSPPGFSVQYLDVWVQIPLMAFSALGPGWGLILTMASFNNFKTNILKYSWLLCLAQFGVVFGLGLQEMLIRNFIQKPNPEQIHFQFLHTQWMEFLVTPSALTFLELPHMWSLLFFTMMILGTLNLLVVQLFSVLTSLFDEYENLRLMKREVTLVAMFVLGMFSILFCSNHGITMSELFAKFSTSTQMILNLFLLLVVLWIYGCDRFQRDLHFMTSRTYPNWMLTIVKFVAPVVLLISWVMAVFLTFNIGYNNLILWSILLLTTLLPWCLVPGFCIFKMLQTSGMIKMRFKRSVRPNDWYPADSVYRQQYEDVFSNSEVSHQLTTEEIE